MTPSEKQLGKISKIKRPQSLQPWGKKTIVSKPSNQLYRANWELIFGGKKDGDESNIQLSNGNSEIIIHEGQEEAQTEDQKGRNSSELPTTGEELSDSSAQCM